MMLRTLSAGGGMGDFNISPTNRCYDASHDPGWTHCQLPILCLLPGTTCACSAAEEACMAGGASPISLTPAVAKVTSPGLPVGYDPTTGTVDPSNTTGATVLPDPGAYGAAIGAQLPAPPCDGESFGCRYLGIGCVDSDCAPGVMSMLIMGGVVILAAVLSADFIAGKASR